MNSSPSAVPDRSFTGFAGRVPRLLALLLLLLGVGISAWGATFSGRVTRAGRGEAGVTITASSLFELNKSVTTDANGNYSIDYNAQFTIFLTPSKSGIKFNPGSRQVVSFTGNQSGVDFELVLLGGQARLRDGSPAPGVTVKLLSTTSSLFWTTTTDANGRYEITGNFVLPDSFRAEASLNGIAFSGTFLNWNGGFMLADPFYPNYDRSADFVLNDQRMVAGYVRWGTSPMAGVTVRTLNGAPLFGSSYSTVTDASGFYAFPQAASVPSSTAFTVEAVLPNWSFSPASDGHLSQGVANHNFYAAGDIAGQVTHGTPEFGSFQVKVFVPGETQPVGQATLDGNGSFYLTRMRQAGSGIPWTVQFFRNNQLFESRVAHVYTGGVNATYFPVAEAEGRLAYQNNEQDSFSAIQFIIPSPTSARQVRLSQNPDANRFIQQASIQPRATLDMHGASDFNNGAFGLFAPFGADLSTTIPMQDGVNYTFSVESDDGAILYVDDQVLVDNDGVHAPQTKTTSIIFTPPPGVSAGNRNHTFRVRYFDSAFGSSTLLRVLYSANGGPMNLLSGSWSGFRMLLPTVFDLSLANNMLLSNGRRGTIFDVPHFGSVTVRIGAGQQGFRYEQQYLTGPVNFLATFVNQGGGYTGRVTDAEDLPLGNVTVTVAAGEGQPVATAVSDPDGYYTIPATIIRRNATTLTASLAGFTFNSHSLASANTANFRANESAPRLNVISSVTTPEDTPITVPFTVRDAQTPAASLIVTAKSGDENIISSGDLVLGGSGENRTVTLQPVLNATGTGSVILTVHESEPKPFSVRTIRVRTGDPGIGPVDSTGLAETILGNQGVWGGVTTATSPTINFINAASAPHFGSAVGFPGIDPNVNVDNFVVEVTGHVVVPTRGYWTFGVNSDDGFKCDVGGNVFSFGGDRGAGDTVAGYWFEPGVHPVRIIYYEHGGAAALQFFAAKGVHYHFDDSFRLVGDVANGGLATVVAPGNGQQSSKSFTVIVEPRNDAPTAGAYTGVRLNKGRLDAANLGGLISGDEMTLEFWQKVTTPQWQETLGVYPGQGDKLIRTYVPYGDGYVYFDDGDWRGPGRLAYLPPENIIGTWQHWAFVASKSHQAMRIYRNGKLEASRQWNGGLSPNSASLILGSDTYQGDIAELRAWKVARDEADILANKDIPLRGDEAGLVAYYRFLEGVGPKANDSALAEGNNALQSVIGYPLPEFLRDNAAGDPGLKFTGEQWIETPDFGAALPTQEITVEFWSKTEGKGSHRTLGLAGSAANSAMHVHIPWDQDGRVYWDFGDVYGDGRLSYLPSENILDSWQHWAFVASKSGQVMRIYRNGKLEAERSSSVNFSADPAAILYIGKTFWGVFDGQLADFRIWNHARSPQAIMASKDVPVSPSEPGLVLNYRFQEGSGTNLADLATSVGGNNSATLVNGPQWMASSTGNIHPLPVDEDGVRDLYLPSFDFDTASLNYANPVAPAHGTLTQVGGAVWRYRPAPNYNGPDSFVYSVTDTAGASASARILLTVSDINDLPVIEQISSLTITEGRPSAPIAFRVTDSDGASEDVTLQARSSDQSLVRDVNLVLTGNGADRVLTIIPETGQLGTLTVTLIARDLLLGKSEINFQVRIEPSPNYSLQSLGIPANFTLGAAINDRGAVAANGSSSDLQTDVRAYLHEGLNAGSGVSQLGTLGGVTKAWGINGANEVVGVSFVGNAPHAFKLDGKTLIDLGTLDGGQSEARAINEAGVVVGFARAGGVNRAFRVVPGNPVENLGTLGSPFNHASEAYAVNIDGDIAGASFNSGGNSYAFLRTIDGTMTALPTLGGPNSYGRSLNRFREVVGSSTLPNGDRRAVLWRETGLVNLGTLPSGGNSEAYAINDFGQIVGTAIDRDGKPRATLFTQGQLFDLNDLLPEEQAADWSLTEAVGINLRGEIVANGVSRNNDGLTRGFILIPATVIGTAATRPQGAVARAPEIELLRGNADDTSQNSFQFSAAPGEKKLYAIRPVTARLKWPVSDDTLNTNRVTIVSVNIWPRVPQYHVATAPVELEPVVEGFAHKFMQILHTTSSDAAVDPNTKVFNATNSGYSVIWYLRNNGAQPNPQLHPPYYEVTRTLPYDDSRIYKTDQATFVGDPLTSTEHRDYPGRNGFLLFPQTLVDSGGDEPAYDRSTRTGALIPVNTFANANNATPKPQLLAVAWYATNRIGVAWGQRSANYLPLWPVNGDKIIIASGLGAGQLPANVYQDIRLYNQPNPSLPGFNPNEEHALVLPGPSGETIYALRNDLNASANYSAPFALLKYRDPSTSAREWRMRAFRVEITGDGYDFTYDGDVGKEIQPPFPLSVFTLCDGSEIDSSSSPYAWRDRNRKFYARAAGPGLNDIANVVLRYQYPLQNGFYYDPSVAPGSCIPWLDRRPGGTLGRSINITYRIHWPTNAPALQIGETLLRARRGLPDLANFFSAEIIYDSTNPDGNDYASARTRMFDPLTTRSLALNTLSNLTVSGSSYQFPANLKRTRVAGKETFDDLPPDLADRLIYDPVNRLLVFKGTLDETVVGEPLLLPNVMSPRERDRIKAIDDNTLGGKANWEKVVDALYALTRNPHRVDLDRNGVVDPALRIGLANQFTIRTNGLTNLVYERPTSAKVDVLATNVVPEPLMEAKALIAAGYENFTGPRFITIAENNSSEAEGPVALHVIKVEGGPHVGDLKFLSPANVFSEKLTVRHSSDFGAEPERLEFEWYYKPDSAGFNPTVLPDVAADGTISNSRGWLTYKPSSIGDGTGANSITLGDGGESSLLTLGDNWFIGRYRGYNVDGTVAWSGWVGDPSGGGTPRAALAEGWIKRVVRGVNPFDQRFSDFHKNQVDTFASMLIQAGERYEGDIAFNADALENVGLISVYTTLLNRGKKLSIEGIPAVNYDPANNALLFAASRVSDLYTLLGNEAFADATDPTIGFGIGSGEYGSAATSIHAFQNQMPNLLEEELALLRGRDASSAGTSASPVYNRLYWNFTLGDGELAYQQSFNISDFDLDGFISEKDARIQYPQGHGDAWGHYLTAITTYYDLLRHPNFTWVPRSESVNLLGTALAVDYLDERKFARLASARAKTGAEIVSLTYREKYLDDTQGQWQGYKDTDTDRAWGVTEWARRAGQAVVFDWITANALLYANDPDPTHTGVQQIDRQTVLELREIPAHLSDIQKHLDMADIGLSPVGVAKGAVPFDIDPAAFSATVLSERKGHFEQVADRAIKAMNNAVKVWDEANKFTGLLRRNQDDVDKFVPGVVDEETDYKNRLIEIFGYPYAGDIGNGKTYPTGYDGPDTYHWMYVDTRELTGETAPVSASFSGFFKPTRNGLSGFTHFPGSEQAFARNFDYNTLDTSVLEVNYPQAVATYTFVAPETWGKRRAPGKIQEALSDVVQEEGRLKLALQNYDGLILNIQDQLQLLAAQKKVDADQIKLLSGKANTLQGMNAVMGVLKGTQITLRRVAGVIRDIADITADATPKTAGLAFDIGSIPAGLIEGSAYSATLGTEISADILEIAENSIDLAKEDVELRTEIKLEVVSRDFEVLQRVKEIESMMRDEVCSRIEVFTQREVLAQSMGRYLAAIAEGERLLEELTVFRQRTSADISEQRYEDMTFRLFRNEALQKYRAAYDLAARYVFLAANAYDYEVNFLGSDARSGRDFLTDIVKQRTIGQMIDGQPLVGQGGLADPLARMLANWSVLKTRFGINNPLVADSRFSLRREMLRIKGGSSGDALWKETLTRARVENLWDLPEFRRYCRPFVSESAGAQPGLVLRFPTTITFGQNFFGWPLSGGDSNYDPTRFSTKIRRAGVWFTGSDGSQISQTPNIYLVPVGMDIMRSPTGDTLATREWRVVDQVVPEPFPIGKNALSNPDWIPQFDSVSGTFADIRRYSSFPAYHDQGIYQEGQTTPDSRLVGRSVWNTDWMLIIPGGTLLNDPDKGLDALINTVDDIKVYFQTYSYSGN